MGKDFVCLKKLLLALASSTIMRSCLGVFGGNGPEGDEESTSISSSLSSESSALLYVSVCVCGGGGGGGVTRQRQIFSLHQKQQEILPST